MGNIYGNTAVSAAKACKEDNLLRPAASWNRAIARFTNSESSKRKGCPKIAFLGLCANGFVAGIEPSLQVKPTVNGSYACDAAMILFNLEGAEQPSASVLWTLVAGEKKKMNGQMHVVLALFEKRQLVHPA